MDNRPDLPPLESVEAGSRQILPVLIIMPMTLTPVAVVMILGFLFYRPYLGTEAWVLSGILVLLALWVAGRMLSGFFSYKTDPTGLALGGPLRRAFIPWGEVNEAYTKEAASEKVIILQATSGRFTIAPHGTAGRQGDLVIASIRQHLGKIGKADRITLPAAALSLWDIIPEELPREMDWTGPSRLGENIAAAFVFLMFGAGLVFMWSDVREKPMSLTLALPYTLAVAFIFRTLLPPSFLRKAVSVVLREDYLEARFVVGKASMMWSEVTSAYWNNEGLVIAGGRPRREIRIPWAMKSDDSSMLILAIIRRLRTAGVPQAVTIPDVLRCFERTTGPQDGAELRLSKAEVRLIRWGIASVGILIAVAPMLRPPSEPMVTIIATALSLLWLLVSGPLVNSYYIRVDSEGFTRAFLGRKRFISWQEVAQSAWSPLGRSIRLKNANGKTLTEITMCFGTEEDRVRMQAALRGRTDTLIPPKPWLARLWGSGE